MSEDNGEFLPLPKNISKNYLKLSYPEHGNDKVLVKFDRLHVKTSLKIFKHYKLKPSFSIIKDEKEKDKVGVGDKPPPPKFQQFDQV